MKKLLALVLAISVLAVACGDDDAVTTTQAPTTTEAPTTTSAASLAEEASIGDCDGLATATIVMLQDVIDFMGAISPEEFADISEGVPNETLDDIAIRGEAIGNRAVELECTDLDATVQGLADQLTAEPTNAIGQLIVQGTKDGTDVMSRLFR